MKLRTLARALCTVGVALMLTAQGTHAQRGRQEDSRIQQASRLETSGDVAGAEVLLLTAARETPEQVPVLLALERLLGTVDGLERILAPLDVHLSARPRSTMGRVLQLRVLDELDRPTELAEAMDEWIEMDPLSPDPYREISLRHVERGDAAAAEQVLRSGRINAADPAALALPLVALLLDGGRDGEVAALLAEVALDRPSDGVMVAEQLVRIPTGSREAAGEEILDSLSAAEDPAHLLVAIRVAVVSAAPERARELAEAGDDRFVGEEARGFLTEIAQIARDHGSADLSVWALDRLRARADRDRADRRVQVEEERLAAGALASGDTARAMEARRRILDALDPGTEERRRALASWLRLSVRAGDVDDALNGLSELRTGFPEAPELDELAAAVARRLVQDGREAEAPEVLRGVEGPLVLRETAILLLLASETASAATALITASTGLSSDQATQALEIVTVLKRLEASDAAVAGQGFALAHYGRVEDALAILEAQATQATDPQASASLLAVGARLAEEFGPEASAVTLRRAIVDGYPDAREWPESALRLGRALARSTTGQAEARELLQRLVLAHSDHPLAADARRALERLTGGSDE